MEVNSNQLPKEILHIVLDYLCTGRESYQDMFLRYPPHHWSVPTSIRHIEGQQNWQSILSISLVSKRLRELCLERIFGTIVLTKMKKIGQLWKLLEVNPRLGAFTHTCHLEYYCRLVKQCFYPSQVMTLIFASRVDSIKERVEAAHQEAERERRERQENPDEWESADEAHDAELMITEDLEQKIDELNREYALVGPDGMGMDEIIKNPSDLKEATTFIFSKWTRLQHLYWQSYQIPLFTTVISSIAAHQSLKSLQIRLTACDEDFLTDSTIHSPTPPLWLLGPQLESLRISSPSFISEALQRQDQQLRAALKLIRQAPKLNHLAQSGFFGWGKDEADKEPSVESSGFLSLDQFVQQVLPCIASIPSVEIWTRWRDVLDLPAQKLHSYLQQAHSRKLFQRLEKQDIVELGKLAEDEENHELKGISDYLLDEEVAGEMARIWNQRYQGVL